MKKYLKLSNVTINDDKKYDYIALGEWIKAKDMSHDTSEVKSYIKYSHDVCEIIENYYEIIFKELAVYLNEYHGLKNDNLYWRIIIGPWLYRFIASAYDRYRHFKKVIEENGEIFTNILSFNDYRIPLDTITFRRLINSEFYNFQLVSDIAKLMKMESYEANSFGKEIDVFYKILCGKNQYTSKIEVSYLNGIYIKLFNMQLVSNKQDILVNYPKEFNKVIYKCTDRYCMNISSITNDEFINIVAKIIHNYIPVMYMELFKSMSNIVKGAYINKAYYFINEDWHQNEFLKFLGAEIHNNNVKIIAVNPSGVCGILKYTFEEKHETEISDYVWSREKTAKVDAYIPIAVYEYHSGRNKNILFITAAFYGPYNNLFDRCPIGKYEIDKYFCKQKKFIDNLNKNVMANFLYRFHPYRTNKEEQDRIKSFNYKTSLTDNISLLIKEAQVVIIDHITTTFFEVLANKVPFILLLDSDLWEITDEYKLCMENLKEVCVYWESPIEAAQYINSISNFDEWWVEPERQYKVDKVRNKLLAVQVSESPSLSRNIDELLKWI